MTAAADDHNVVFGARLGAAPGARPVRVIAKRIAGKTEDRIFQRCEQE